MCLSQGFASGDCDRDAQAVRVFLADGHKMALSQSYAKVRYMHDRMRACSDELLWGVPSIQDRHILR